MNVKLIFQKDGENTLAGNIQASFQRKPKKVYFFSGTLKETGFKIIEEELIDTTAKIFFAVGIDKKNTTRNMLESILSYTKDLYVYSNNQVLEFDSNICIFEYTKEVVIYNSNANISDSGLCDNLSLYTETIFDLENKDENQMYKKMLKDITTALENYNFTKLSKTGIEKLVEDKEIFSTKQYNHAVKSIAELLGNTASKPQVKEQTKEEIDDVFVKDIPIPKVDLSGINIDIDEIDLSGVEEINLTNMEEVTELKEEKKTKKKNKENEISIDYDTVKEKEELDFKSLKNALQEEVEIDKSNELYSEELENMEFDDNETLDIDQMLFSKANIKLDVKSKKDELDASEEEAEIDEYSEEELVQVKKVNLNNVTNLIFELPNKASKGQDVNNIKIPNYIKNIIPEFFELAENGKNITVDGIVYRQRNIKIEIINVKEGNKYTDRDAKFIFRNGQSYLTLNSNAIKNINYTENDIIRIIKLSNDIYHIEVIPQEMQEYKLWSKLCTQKFKASDRKYGMM